MSMKRTQRILAVALALGLTMGGLWEAGAADAAQALRYSQTVEKERPELDEVTRGLIAAYRKAPTEENKAALRERVAANYDKVVEKKKAKLEELRATARDQSKIDEMEEIVTQMVEEREARIDQTLSRLTDARLRPGSRESADGFLPLMGAGENLYIAYAPVTNAEYAAFLQATGRRAPEGLERAGANLPVVNVTAADAQAYCDWLTAKDAGALYRLPTAEEWELAAGHFPKDADINCEEPLAAVRTYEATLAASGAVDMWGGVWEMTSTPGAGGLIVKGGAFDSARTECRTEYSGKTIPQGAAQANTGFRVLRETLN